MRHILKWERLAFRFFLQIAFLLVATALTVYITTVYTFSLLVLMAFPYKVGSLEAHLGFTTMTGWVTVGYLMYRIKQTFNTIRKS
jgi:hypothetical protein